MRSNLSALVAVLLSLPAAPLQIMAVAVVLCVFAARSPAAIVHYGNDVAFSEPPEGEGIRPNYLLGSKCTVTQPIVLQKAGILFGSAITNAKVGIYTDAGGAPNTLVAETGSFEVYFDSVLETPLLTTPTIPAGDYWFMAVFDAVETPVGISYDDGPQVAYIAHTFNSPLPATFPAPSLYTGQAFNYYLVGETTISGDANYDGLVNIFDINLVSAHWAETGPAGDVNGDAIVNIFDINLISANWTPTGGGSATAVPEPATLIMALCGLVGVGYWSGSRRAAARGSANGNHSR
jgi:PEP-CTERM motif